MIRLLERRFLASRGPRECELTFSLEGEGRGVGALGPPFAALYAKNLDRAIPRLVRELEAR